MKTIILKLFKKYILMILYEKVISVLEEKAKKTDNKWDDELINDIKNIIDNVFK